MPVNTIEFEFVSDIILVMCQCMYNILQVWKLWTIFLMSVKLGLLNHKFTVYYWSPLTSMEYTHWSIVKCWTPEQTATALTGRLEPSCICCWTSEQICLTKGMEYSEEGSNKEKVGRDRQIRLGRALTKQIGPSCDCTPWFQTLFPGLINLLWSNQICASYRAGTDPSWPIVSTGVYPRGKYTKNTFSSEPFPWNLDTHFTNAAPSTCLV